MVRTPFEEIDVRVLEDHFSFDPLQTARAETYCEIIEEVIAIFVFVFHYGVCIRCVLSALMSRVAFGDSLCDQNALLWLAQVRFSLSLR